MLTPSEFESQLTTLHCLMCDTGRDEPHISHKIEPLCSLTPSQQEDLDFLLDRVHAEEKNLQSKLNPGHNILSDGGYGIEKVLDDLHNHFLKIHRLLDRREEELADDIKEKSEHIIRKGLNE